MKRGVLGILGFLAERTMRATTRALLTEIGATAAELSGPVSRLSGGQRQAVAVVRATHWANRAFLLDEPTAALGPVQAKRVLDTARAAAADGNAVLLISHDLPDVLAISPGGE